jgi:hypothetical protein
MTMPPPLATLPSPLGTRSSNKWGRCSLTINSSRQLGKTTSAFARGSTREPRPASLRRGVKFSYTVHASQSIRQVEARQAFVAIAGASTQHDATHCLHWQRQKAVGTESTPEPLVTVTETRACRWRARRRARCPRACGGSLFRCDAAGADLTRSEPCVGGVERVDIAQQQPEMARTLFGPTRLP